jgi:hypothetical protein
MSVSPKNVMKVHLNVHHSNSPPYVATNTGNHRGRPSPLKNKDRLQSGGCGNPARSSPYEVEQRYGVSAHRAETRSVVISEESHMFTAEEFRVKAAEYTELLKGTENPNEIRDFNRLKESFTRLAQNEDWLAHNFEKIIHSQDVVPQPEAAETPVDRRTVAEIEEHILRCLGAAVIMQWNTIPTKLQRELFDTAGSLGDVLKTAALRGQIARFLHSHKDGENPQSDQGKIHDR